MAAEHRGFWQDLASELAARRPSPGKRVIVVGGRKHRGKVGVVIRHMQSRYDQAAFRYGSDAAFHMREMAGRYGFACQIRAEDGSTFWVKADYTEPADFFEAMQEGLEALGKH